MWHEARKQERKIRGMLVDYRRRAERRQDFYEKIKADPTQFMQIHGRKCKIHLDPAVALLGDGAAIIVPWQGQKDNLIDRFDVRAHLDYIPPVQKLTDLEETTTEERQCNYERYRILAQNDFLCISEDKYLHQLYLEEQFGANAQLENEIQQQRSNNKKPANSGAAIGYTYEDSEPTAPFSHILNSNSVNIPANVPVDDDEETDSDIDMDVSIEINKLDNNQAHDLNTCGRNYGMMSNDFYSFLVKDADEADAIRMAREEEQEKIMLSGRKSRRERRAQRERRCAGRPLSPPSYAAKVEPVENQNDNDSESRSPSPENSGKITYITSFGGEDELQPHSKISININKPQKSFGSSISGQHGLEGGMTYADKVKANLEKLKQMNESNRNYRKKDSHSPKKPKQYLRSDSRSRSRSRSRYRRRRSRSYSRNRSRNRSRSRSGRGGRSYKDRRSGRHHSSNSRSISRTRSYNRRRNYSRSRTPHKSSQSHYRRHRSTSSSSSSSTVDHRKRDHSRRKSIKRRSETPVNRKSRSKSITKGIITIGTAKPTSPNPISKAIALSETVLDIQQQQQQVQQQQPQQPISKIVPIQKTLTPPPQIPPAPIKRYYGRKRDNDSSSSSSSDADETEKPMEINDNSNSNNFPSGLPANFNLPAIPSGSGNNNMIYGSSGNTNSSVGNNNFLNNYSKSTVNPITSVSENKTIINTASTSSSSSANLRDRLKRKMQILLNKQYKADKKAETERTERQIQQQQEREDEMRELALKLRRRQRELRHKYGTPTDSEDDDAATTSTIHSLNEKEITTVVKKRSKSKSPERGKNRGRHYSRSSSRGYSRRRHRSRSHSPYNRNNRNIRTSSSRNNRCKDRNYNRRSRDRSRSRDYDRSDRYRNRNGNQYSRSTSKSKLKQLVDY